MALARTAERDAIARAHRLAAAFSARVRELQVEGAAVVLEVDDAGDLVVRDLVDPTAWRLSRELVSLVADLRDERGVALELALEVGAVVVRQV